MTRKVVVEWELELENGRISLDGGDRRIYLYPVVREWHGHGEYPLKVRITVEQIGEEED